jgi:methylated-DNA-[protein]-cysteine S-methyltransferase
MERLLRLHYGTAQVESGAAPDTIKRLLRSYFEGDVKCLAGIEWRTAGTSFQRSVWAGLTTIPPGQTMSYGGLAAKLGCPKAVRAVGTANGSNPVSVVVPCHRVIGADGSLTGYGGGIERKRWLLRHENAVFRADPARQAQAA